MTPLAARPTTGSMLNRSPCRRARSPRAPLAVLRAFAPLVLIVLCTQAQAQPGDRIPFHEQEIWVSGGNIAWVDFARDIGPGTTNLAQFEQIFVQTREHGGNALRLWLHTNGSSTPQFSAAGPAGVVIGPGEGAIEDLRDILDLALQHEVALKLCLWSFDMLQENQYQADPERSRTLLTDVDRLQAYIDHALIPMVEELKGHPAILAWEIFNEPEGMSVQFGWTPLRVNMSQIQRFINRTAGAIKRTDPGALVTNGSWSFRASSDVEPHFYNYYRDDRLIAAGGDEDGTLDFYSVHYYEHFGSAHSPFHRDAAFWGLDKPLVIAEFFLYDTTDGNPDATFGVPWEQMYEELYDRGYAGAMAWQWSGSEGVQNWPRILASMEHMHGLYPDDIEIDFPGIRMSLSANPVNIELGGETTLTWRVRGAETVTMNGESVEHEDSQVFILEETTLFTLLATDADGNSDSREVTVFVVDPDQLNRALNRPALASSEEVCCGPTQAAAFAFDGDSTTRWSSEWHQDYADADPDDEWIQVDLGEVYDLIRIVLDWEAAYGSHYLIQRSFDGQIWTTIHEEAAGSGGTDIIEFAGTPPARFVRMQGIDRGTQYGYSLWEFEVYGTASDVQLPTASFVLPAEGAIVAPGSDVGVTITAAAPAGAVTQVTLLANGEEVVTLTDPPYNTVWQDVPQGEHLLAAVVSDDSGITVMSAPITVFAVHTAGFPRYEAEEAILAGDVTVVGHPPASGGAYVDMKDSGSITFQNVTVDQAGEYLLVFGYNLGYDVPKCQFIVVNGAQIGEPCFTGTLNTWRQRGLRVPLLAGTNTIVIEKSWGWMYFDYIEVSGQPLTVPTEDAAVPAPLVLAQNFPNPFAGETTITYELLAASAVRLEVFDVTGRRVAVLVDEVQPPGPQSARFSAAGLASGVYLYRLATEEAVVTRRLVIAR